MKSHMSRLIVVSRRAQEEADLREEQVRYLQVASL